MPSTFARTKDKFRSTLAAPHAIGDGVLTLAAGAAASLGAPGADRVWRVTAVQLPGTPQEAVLGVFDATGVAGATLTGVTAAAGYSDVVVPSGTPIHLRLTAGHVDEIQVALNAAEVAVVARLVAASNLSDLPSPVAARLNLGLGVLFPVSDYMTASRRAGTGAGTVDDSGAWIACWAACTAAGGGEIVVDLPLWLKGGTDIPGAQWDALNTASNLVVRGRGDATVITLAMPGKYFTALANWNMVTFADLVIVPAVDDGAESCQGIFTGYASKMRWERCTVLGVRANGPVFRFSAGWTTMEGCDISGCGSTNGPSTIEFDDSYGRLSDHRSVDLGWVKGVQYAGGRNTAYPWVRLYTNGTDGTAARMAGDQVALVVQNSFFDEGALFAVQVLKKNPAGRRIKQVVIENTSGNAMVPLQGVYSFAGLDSLVLDGGDFGWNDPPTMITLRDVGAARLERLNANMQTVPTKVDADATVGLVEMIECGNIAKSAGYAALRTITRSNGVTTYEPNWSVTGDLALTGGVTASTSVITPIIAGGTAPGDDLWMLSSTDPIKGKIKLGMNSAFDGVNNWLGVGTLVPLSLLDVRGTTVGVSGYAMRVIDSNTTHGSVMVFGFTGAPAGDKYKAFFVDSNGLNIGTLPDALNASPTAALTIATNGNVGIARTPNYRLDVGGGVVRLLGAQFLFHDPAITFGTTFEQSTTQFGVSTNDTKPIVLATNNTDRLEVHGSAGVSTLGLKGLSSTATTRSQAVVKGEWATATDASRKGRVTLLASDSTGTDRECVRAESSGTAAMLGFYGTTAVVRPATTGQTAGFTAGAGTAVLSDSTFTGGTGSTAYTVGDVVKALKALGLMAP